MHIIESQATYKLSAIIESPGERQRYHDAYRSMDPIAVPEIHGKDTFIIEELSIMDWLKDSQVLVHLLLRQDGTTKCPRPTKTEAVYEEWVE